MQGGETLAVLCASGGVGLAAVELGKLMGARVIACASSDDKLDFCRSLGADEVVNYEKQNLKDALRALAKDGVDVVYDPVGGDLTELAVRALAWDGRHLVIGFAQGQIPKLPLNLVLLKSANIQGVFWGAHTERDVLIEAGNFFDAHAGRGDDLVARDHRPDVDLARMHFHTELPEDPDEVGL